MLVAPLRVALQSYSVAPLGVARPKGAATPPSEKMQSLLGLATQWRDRVGLSRQWCWRDRCPLPRHCVPKPSKDCIFHLVAWQVFLVAPLPVARQISFVAPPGVARQAQNSAALPCFCCCSLLLLLSRCCLLLLLVLKLLMVQ